MQRTASILPMIHPPIEVAGTAALRIEDEIESSEDEEIELAIILFRGGILMIL
jgi:hypothetical protein